MWNWEHHNKLEMEAVEKTMYWRNMASFDEPPVRRTIPPGLVQVLYGAALGIFFGTLIGYRMFLY